ncbi:flagellar basal body rod protein FlgB [Vampirovibrio sp.]|uniref:flagellar basal body rod protein FlgB n=1 Tax=Vampirovibrio sp. TaxID=2717857 RepID=UPI003593E871
MDLITSLTSQVMNKALDGLSKRHKAIASNLANVDTPHYKRRDVTFEGALNHAIREIKGQGSLARKQASNEDPLPMRVSRSEHIPVGHMAASLEEVNPAFTEAEDMEYRMDGNSVDVETEMVQLAKNTERFNAVAKMESGYFRGLRSVITGGGS